MAASTKLSLAFILLALSGLVVLREVEGAQAKVNCAAAVPCFQGGSYMTCDNYPGQRLSGCICECVPKNGKGCKLRMQDGTTYKCN